MEKKSNTNFEYSARIKINFYRLIPRTCMIKKIIAILFHPSGAPTLSSVSGEAHRHQPDHVHQLDVGVRCDVRVQRTDALGGPVRHVPDVQCVLLARRRVRRRDRPGNEEQDAGPNPAGARWRANRPGTDPGDGRSDNGVPVIPVPIRLLDVLSPEDEQKSSRQTHLHLSRYLMLKWENILLIRLKIVYVFI